MSSLILKHANKNRLGAIDWGPNDFGVCESDRCIGRIFLPPQSPPDRSWMWTITTRDYPRTIHSRGYSATREQAMTDFKAQCCRRSKPKEGSRVALNGSLRNLPAWRYCGNESRRKRDFIGRYISFLMAP